MTTADFAAFSNNAVMFASIVYVLAFVAHVTEWATGRAVTVTEVTEVAEPEAALVGGSPSPAQAAPRPVDEDHEERVDKWGRIGLALTVVAVLLHGAALVTRGLGADPIRVPWGNMYEFTLAGSFGVGLMYLLLGRRYHLRWMGLPVTAFEVVVLMLAGLLLYVPAGPLVPALHSYWLVIHVAAAVVASGAFAVGAIAAVLFLVKDRAGRRGSLRPGGYLDRLPELNALDRLSYRLHAFGFPIWTFAALVAGPIWAEYAWGRYWNWDPKEVWAFITWVVYAAYLHARATAGWRGKAAAVIALVGFATLLFNFVGINFFFGGGSLHSYAG
ncbi:c-type cytochrome biogenesis protein CcsB [Nocardioides iriomotensis]|uniref:C-type cytochrome biogenesis protein CcsB n=1 Tax=Nocardioides iriomotensis TaxID=715784 RepID=A0A4Q5JAE5_9ACTN|nr:c-type cytochrome biogenesis protein CcsB [Nocardioides iriomotensis]RYU14891.1 c-type cytochrome biogenesis protein CcsB [Nocardioides iriomotensis]